MDQSLMMTRHIIGLTGGIATGKSTVAHYLNKQYHLPILDADIYAREAVEPHTEIWQQIIKRYGNGLLLPDNQLNRHQLGEIIFNNVTEKHWLEQQIHPFVRQRFSQVTQTYSPDQPLVYVIPLLFEANLTALVTDIWVVTCTPSQQIQRLIARNQLSTAQAEARIANQMSLPEKVAQADIVLDNTGSHEALIAQIDVALINLAQYLTGYS